MQSRFLIGRLGGGVTEAANGTGAAASQVLTAARALPANLRGSRMWSRNSSQAGRRLGPPSEIPNEEAADRETNAANTLSPQLHPAKQSRLPLLTTLKPDDIQRSAADARIGAKRTFVPTAPLGVFHLPNFVVGFPVICLAFP